MRTQHKPGIWNQCPGSYWVINSQFWSGTRGHRPDHTELADRDEKSTSWHLLGHRAG